MVTLTAIYKKPDDQTSFDEHYTNVHAPLVRKTPGLQKIEVTKFSKMLTPANAFIADQPYMQCVMYYDDMGAFKAAMASEENKAAGKDLMSFAGPLVSMFIGSTESESI
jgi:uncharacterized protein (TIGR02118 family)